MKLRGTIVEETLTQKRGWQQVPGNKRWVFDLDMEAGEDDILDLLLEEVEKKIKERRRVVKEGEGGDE